jgi:hypothetical protein
MITNERSGGKRIELLLPFTHEGRTVKFIVLGPMKFAHLLNWQQGEYNSAMALLFDVSSEPEAVIRELRYPDVDRVMNEFFSILPPEVRDSIASGTIPRKVDLDEIAPLAPGEADPVAPEENPVAEEPQPDPQWNEPMVEEPYMPGAEEQEKGIGFEGI